jgi:hypothetical protein
MMEKRIKIIQSDYIRDLERTINSFLQESNGKLHDLKYQKADCDEVFHTVILIYTPEE